MTKEKIFNNKIVEIVAVDMRRCKLRSNIDDSLFPVVG